MSYFTSADEVQQYVGGIFLKANDHPEVGPKLRGADMVLRLTYTEPDADMVVLLRQPQIEVHPGPGEWQSDVHLTLPGDIADRYWRGDYNLAVGLAKGQVKAKGPVNKLLKLVPLTRPLFPIYKELVADKDRDSVSLPS